MRTRGVETSRARIRRALYLVVALTLGLFGLGSWLATDTADFAAYALIVASALLPSALWILSGARGIPIIPVIALGHVVYFAMPIVRGTAAELGYDDAETLRGAATVALFLVVAALAAQAAMLRLPKARNAVAPDRWEGRELNQLMLGGLALGAIYQLALAAGALNWLGYYGGLVRAVLLTLVVSACYLFGVATGHRRLTRRVMILAGVGVVANVMLTWMSIFLVGGIFFLLSAALGYSISAARVPWRSALVAILVVAVLHAGKQEMREKYWDEQTNYSDYYTKPSYPVFMMEWVTAGLAAIFGGDVGKDISQRASLVWIILYVQRICPNPIPFLDGATYALLPQMLVPRFLDPNKISSQAGMNLLNVHFGILSEEATERTAVGWGPLAEGYGNFGYFGVAGAAIVLGLFGGALTAWSAGAAPVSLPAMLAIAAMLQMANLEADLSYLFTSMLQGFAGVLIYYGIFRFLTRRRRGRADLVAFAPVPRPRSER